MNVLKCTNQPIYDNLLSCSSTYLHTVYLDHEIIPCQYNPFYVVYPRNNIINTCHCLNQYWNHHRHDCVSKVQEIIYLHIACCIVYVDELNFYYTICFFFYTQLHEPEYHDHTCNNNITFVSASQVYFQFSQGIVHIYRVKY